ncbi:MAG: 4-hydroxy-tetrahydrodipicolinate reductase [Deltaproteobacteria bacterium]|nr:4-hydroxy-tetrahydrodipicolinate reductase [Deltaproteobacteria bacterium]MBW2253030.1 4-hydroxy-tetrahydrodipicolinate reductase [Deltaproteobacteria bacterium]
MRLAVLGATGRVGRLVVAEAMAAHDLDLVAAVATDIPGEDAGRVAGTSDAGVVLAPVAEGCFARAEVVVDFSTPEGLMEALPHLGSGALVTGTTGLGQEETNRLLARSEVAPVLSAPNFSTGVTLLLDLVRRTAEALPDYDVEVVETHHRNKIDAPSGTALALARAAARAHGTDLENRAVFGRAGRTGPRETGDIGVHAVRMGDVVGEHQVWFAGRGDRVLIGHTATSRTTFAEGALRAVRWIRGKPPGRYDMRDVLGLLQ